MAPHVYIIQQGQRFGIAVNNRPVFLSYLQKKSRTILHGETTQEILIITRHLDKGLGCTATQLSQRLQQMSFLTYQSAIFGEFHKLVNKGKLICRRGRCRYNELNILLCHTFTVEHQHLGLPMWITSYFHVSTCAFHLHI
jgi:hypothetical protein